MERFGWFAVCLVAVVALSLVVSTAGCGQTAMDVPTMQALAQAGGAATGSAAVPKPLDVERARQVLTVIDCLRPVAQGLQSAEEIQTVLVPAIDQQVEKYVVNPTMRGVALAFISAGVAAGQSYLTGHPDVAQQTGVAAKVTDAALLGLRNGLTDAIARNGG
jgi:hypothetical protein